MDKSKDSLVDQYNTTQNIFSLTAGQKLYAPPGDARSGVSIYQLSGRKYLSTEWPEVDLTEDGPVLAGHGGGGYPGPGGRMASSPQGRQVRVPELTECPVQTRTT